MLVVVPLEACEVVLQEKWHKIKRLSEGVHFSDPLVVASKDGSIEPDSIEPFGGR